MFYEFKIVLFNEFKIVLFNEFKIVLFNEFKIVLFNEFKIVLFNEFKIVLFNLIIFLSGLCMCLFDLSMYFVLLSHNSLSLLNTRNFDVSVATANGQPNFGTLQFPRGQDCCCCWSQGQCRSICKVAATGSDSAPLQFLAPYTGAATGENFRDNRKDAANKTIPTVKCLCCFVVPLVMRPTLEMFSAKKARAERECLRIESKHKQQSTQFTYLDKS